MSIKALTIVVGAVFFWAFYRIFHPAEKKYAAGEFLNSDRISDEERNVVEKSSIHQILYPIHQWIQKKNPIAKQSYAAIKVELEKAGEYKSRPEDVQIAQIANILIYPIVFLLLSMFMDGQYKPYVVVAGFAAGVYMYGAPMRNLKAKRKKHSENKLREFTRFVTVYIMQAEGNNTPYDSLLIAIKKVLGKSHALRYYLEPLESELMTKGPEKALKDFAQKINETYVDRFVNNILLSINQAGSNPKEINLRLRETLIELQERVTDENIDQMKVIARIPTFLNVGLIAIYMGVILFGSMLRMQG
ncbi:hypothetical protein ACFYU8_18385 [Brevibacillus sp. NPDC003359]|uniref:hypothetical protein n=1 Tax=unclassified Brevibacillus TaxID=2684853 RepID=UPI0036B628DA